MSQGGRQLFHVQDASGGFPPFPPPTAPDIDQLFCEQPEVTVGLQVVPVPDASEGLLPFPLPAHPTTPGLDQPFSEKPEVAAGLDIDNYVSAPTSQFPLPRQGANVGRPALLKTYFLIPLDATPSPVVSSGSSNRRLWIPPTPLIRRPPQAWGRCPLPTQVHLLLHRHERICKRPSAELAGK
ncbi:hypothetical protein B0H10DRAFT_212619 [Mycena sp. CBHHK59/15]|nr:hypothetical protein B0H10DRAFT_212619 [Mycena sp. CBHHK59/15]